MNPRNARHCPEHCSTDATYERTNVTNERQPRHDLEAHVSRRTPGWRRTASYETEFPHATARIEYFESGRAYGWVREHEVES